MDKKSISDGNSLHAITGAEGPELMLRELLAQAGGLAEFHRLAAEAMRQLVVPATLLHLDVCRGNCSCTRSVALVWEETGVVRKFSGSVVDADLVQSAQWVQQSPRFAGIQYVIHDFLDCTSLSVTTATAVDMMARAALATASKQKFCSAFVGNLPELRTMVEVFRSVTSYQKPFSLFASMAEARHYVADVGSCGADGVHSSAGDQVP